MYWRSRGPLTQYLDAAEHVDHALRNGRVLARRTVALLRDQEAVPDGLVEALRTLADAVTALRDELASGTEPERTRALTLQAVRTAADVYRAGIGFSGGVVVAQVRTMATDLLLASGLPRPVVARYLEGLGDACHEAAWLWVLVNNHAARRFYVANGGRMLFSRPVPGMPPLVEARYRFTPPAEEA